ncbi:hypothetical protein LAZ67_12003596 [Cordylochernes scorpioides]|uniref:Uncharacterized protein n=1 Tax=Cordylochernes scorpioides TaxID=51811 RepID=A0ABY6L4D4_9ARAC|nr:hypothetical protein LAZ67_12003596 [Cordylochernes scorpioides]
MTRPRHQSKVGERGVDFSCPRCHVAGVKNSIPVWGRTESGYICGKEKTWRLVSGRVDDPVRRLDVYCVERDISQEDIHGAKDSSDGEVEMGPLRLSKTLSNLWIPWPCLIIDGQAEYSWWEDHAVYLVGPARSGNYELLQPNERITGELHTVHVQPGLHRLVGCPDVKLSWHRLAGSSLEATSHGFSLPQM